MVLVIETAEPPVARSTKPVSLSTSACNWGNSTVSCGFRNRIKNIYIQFFYFAWSVKMSTDFPRFPTSGQNPISKIATQIRMPRMMETALIPLTEIASPFLSDWCWRNVRLTRWPDASMDYYDFDPVKNSGRNQVVPRRKLIQLEVIARSLFTAYCQFVVVGQALIYMLQIL